MPSAALTRFKLFFSLVQYCTDRAFIFIFKPIYVQADRKGARVFNPVDGRFAGRALHYRLRGLWRVAKPLFRKVLLRRLAANGGVRGAKMPKDELSATARSSAEATVANSVHAIQASLVKGHLRSHPKLHLRKNVPLTIRKKQFNSATGQWSRFRFGPLRGGVPLPKSATEVTVCYEDGKAMLSYQPDILWFLAQRASAKDAKTMQCARLPGGLKYVPPVGDAAHGEYAVEQLRNLDDGVPQVAGMDPGSRAYATVALINLLLAMESNDKVAVNKIRRLLFAQDHCDALMDAANHPALRALARRRQKVFAADIKNFVRSGVARFWDDIVKLQLDLLFFPHLPTASMMERVRWQYLCDIDL
jgi:hypothetical protein